jgi:hypothetical protein
LPLKSPIQSKSEVSSPSNKTKKDEYTPNSVGSVSTTLSSERQITRSANFSTAGANQRDVSNPSHLPHLQQASPAYRHAYSMNNAAALMENTSAVATLLNLSRRGAARQAAAAAAAAALVVSTNSTYDKHSSSGHLPSDRESPTSSSSTACTTSSGYPRPKRSRRSENNSDSETNERMEVGATLNSQNEGKDKEDACDIDENFLGEVKQEPMSPPSASPHRSDQNSSESSYTANSLSYSTTPLTRHSTRTKLHNE